MAMIEDYRSALRAGQRAYRACVARGQSPYLAVLDDILNGVNIVAQEPLGLVDIPAESIVGTKTSGRHTAWAANFMPLLENKIYYEFLDFYKLSKINNVQFSRLGGYAKLQTLVCKAASEVWSDDDRLNFSALYTMFSQQFYALGGSALELTPGDALLVYLSVYRYSDACQSTPSQVRENLAKLWDEIKILTEPHAVELSLEPKPGNEPLLNKLNIFSKPSQLKVVFLHEYNAKNSAWVRGHEKGIPGPARNHQPGKCLPRGGRGADHGRGGPRQRGCGVHHQYPDAARLPQGSGPAPQDPVPELLPERAPSAGAYLLPPHL